MKEYYEENKEKISEYRKKYYKKNKNVLLAANARYYGKTRNKIKRTLNTLMSQDLGEEKQVKFYKSWSDFVDYDLDDLLKHLESTFTGRMKWENYGHYWRINRIVKRKDLNIVGVDDNDFKTLWSLDNIEATTIE